MDETVETFVTKIKSLQGELEAELAIRSAALQYRLQGGRALFDREILRAHRKLRVGFIRYVWNAGIQHDHTEIFIPSRVRVAEPAGESCAVLIACESVRESSPARSLTGTPSFMSKKWVCIGHSWYGVARDDQLGDRCGDGREETEEPDHSQVFPYGTASACGLHVFRRFHVESRPAVDKAQMVVDLLDAGGVLRRND